LTLLTAKSLVALTLILQDKEVQLHIEFAGHCLVNSASVSVVPVVCSNTCSKATCVSICTATPPQWYSTLPESHPKPLPRASWDCTAGLCTDPLGTPEEGLFGFDELVGFNETREGDGLLLVEEGQKLVALAKGFLYQDSQARSGLACRETVGHAGDILQ